MKLSLLPGIVFTAGLVLGLLGHWRVGLYLMLLPVVLGCAVGAWLTIAVYVERQRPD